MILQGNENEVLSVKDETHENINDEFNEDEMYGIDKFILDEKKRRERAFESELKVIYDEDRVQPKRTPFSTRHII